ncbi:AVEN regulator, partial [Polyodon spathula]|nr:AVEN regulator [Polyodon spathula]
MEPRGRNRGSGRGGGRGGRGGWRRNAGDKQYRDHHGGEGSETGAPEHRGRGRGGAHRGRGRQEHRGRGHPSPRGRISEKEVEEEVDVKHSDDEDFGPSASSRRKLVSNWDRYEAAEKEGIGESGQSQRGEDFSVLLSSAGRNDQTMKQCCFV